MQTNAATAEAQDSEDWNSDDIIMAGRFGTLSNEERYSLLKDAQELSISDLFARTDLLLSLSTAGMPA